MKNFILALALSVSVLFISSCSSNTSAIEILSDSGKLLELSLEDVGKYHGDICLCVVTTYKAVELAISELWGEETPIRGDFQISTSLLSDGSEDTIEYITRAGTLDDGENFYQNYPADSNETRTLDSYTFTFTRISSGESVRIQLKEGIIPGEYFETRKLTQSPETSTPENRLQLQTMKNKIIDEILDIEPTEIYEFEKK